MYRSPDHAVIIFVCIRYMFYSIYVGMYIYNILHIINQNIVIKAFRYIKNEYFIFNYLC